MIRCVEELLLCLVHLTPLHGGGERGERGWGRGEGRVRRGWGRGEEREGVGEGRGERGGGRGERVG